ncbi:MAG: hypothetical protein QHJ73_20205, partial [Armatimonadota bacterium]|nr:hypothetical protein [Armatimonadota bacterium]
MHLQCTLYAAVMATGAVTPAAPARFYVSPQGRDTWSGRLAAPNPGRADGPFATFERARDAVRAAKA